MNEQKESIEELQEKLKLAMQDKRSENALIEKAQTMLMMNFIERERKAFEFADTSQFILKDKNDIDIMLLMNQIVEWNKKAKPEQQKLLTELFLAILRIQNYTQNLETLNQHTVAKYVTQQELSKSTLSSHASEKLKLELRIKQLETELSNAKKEIEFIQGNNS
jgi:hypothetical protein